MPAFFLVQTAKLTRPWALGVTLAQEDAPKSSYWIVLTPEVASLAVGTTVTGALYQPLVMLLVVVGAAPGA